MCSSLLLVGAHGLLNKLVLVDRGILAGNFAIVQ